MKRVMSSAASSSSARARPPAAVSTGVGSAEQPATSLRSAEPPAVIGDIAAKWTISASLDQVEVPKNMQTHERPMPLPFTINAWIMGKFFERRQYLGHGKSKVCYRLTDNLVLKLRDQRDPEPDLFRQLQATGVYTKVHASAQCQFGHETWHAWVVERAKPLDQILKDYPAASNVCIPGAVRAMLIAHLYNHILSDNALFNFGMVDGNVVIIDAGSRYGQPQVSKLRFTKKVMTPFWIKAQTVIHPATLKCYRQEWHVAGDDMATTLQTLETRWQELRSERRHLSVLNSLDERNSTTAKCPHVTSVIDSLDTDALDWLTQTYLWGEVAEYGPSSDGYTRRQDSNYTAAHKLEQLISETHGQRVHHCNNPAEDILDEAELKVILDAWKNDYEQWMRPEILNKSWSMTASQWQQTLRRAFRSHLFQMVGSYEMAIFFVVAPFNNENLLVFRHCDNLEESKAYVRKKNANTRQA